MNKNIKTVTTPCQTGNSGVNGDELTNNTKEAAMSNKQISNAASVDSSDKLIIGEDAYQLGTPEYMTNEECKKSQKAGSLSDQMCFSPLSHGIQVRCHKGHLKLIKNCYELNYSLTGKKEFTDLTYVKHVGLREDRAHVIFSVVDVDLDESKFRKTMLNIKMLYNYYSFKYEDLDLDLMLIIKAKDGLYSGIVEPLIGNVRPDYVMLSRDNPLSCGMRMDLIRLGEKLLANGYLSGESQYSQVPNMFVHIDHTRNRR